MTIATTNRKSVRKRLHLKYLLPLLAISIFSMASYAATVSVSNSPTYQSVNGVYYNVVGAFTPTSNGFFVSSAGSAAVSCAGTLWSAGPTYSTCQTALTAGRWYYSLTLQLTAQATATQTYTLTVQWTQNGGALSTLGSLSVTTPGTITAGNGITILLDLGATYGTSFTAPAGLTITVQ
jgi:hypothetical protein